MEAHINEPLNHISELFYEHISNPSNSPVTFDPSQVYVDILKNHKDKVLSLNDVPMQQIPKNGLVRFRCMVQDTGLGQEMFISAYEKLDPNGDLKLHCYRYTDDPIDFSEFDEQHGIQNDFLSERSIVYCISPPGENDWSKQAHHTHSELSDHFQQLNISESNPIVSKKFPIPGKEHKSAIIKFYNDMGESIKVGQLIEIIGIRGQEIQKHADENEFETILNMFTDIPVIHAIGYHSLDAANSSPHTQSDNLLQDAQSVRDQLISYISTCLNGDRLAAEFVLLQLLSRVTVKNRGLKIGNFTLNVSGFPSHKVTDEDKKAPLLTMINPVSRSLSEIIQELTIHSVNLPLTIDGLNKTKFTPKSINENLEAGLLQLVDGTVLLIDETVLEEGQLVDAGVRNFQALQNLIQNQSLSYEFPYSQYDFDTDISILSLSTSKSMLPNHCSIRLATTTTTNTHLDNTNTPSKETLNSFRKFIHFAKYLDYEIPEEVSEYIQTTFVNDRKAASKNGTTLPTQEELMLRMNLVRLAAVSFGESKLTKERFDYVVELDKQRKSRLN